MKCRALRGVCIGVGRHLAPADVEVLDPATGKFLVSIGAVEEVKDEPPLAQAPELQPEASAEGKTTPEKTGKSSKEK